MKDELPITTKIYLRAAELIELGHCKHSLHKEIDGRHLYCALGALMAADSECGGNGAYISKYHGLMKRVGDNVPDWNNHPDTTTAMVAAKLREQAFA